MDTILPFLETARVFIVQTFSMISTNMSIDLGIKLVLGYFFIIWAAFIIWVIKDVTNRTTNILVQTLAIFIILFFTPIFGLPIYLLIRPRTTLFEQYYEQEEAEETVDEWEEFYHCPGCNHKVSKDFRFCPKCTLELTVSCPSCKKKIHTDWALCPYCGEKDIISEVKEKSTEAETKPVLSIQQDHIVEEIAQDEKLAMDPKETIKSIES